MAAGWQINEFILRASDTCPDHVRVTSYTPPASQPPKCSQSTPALCSLTLSLYLCVFIWSALEHSCAREMVNADQTVHQLLNGGSSWGWGGGYGGGGGGQKYTMLFSKYDFSPRIPSSNTQL